MKEGQASRTAELVCAGRAAADGRVGDFRDPTALPLLPAAVQKRVEWVRSGKPPPNPPNLKARMYRGYLERQGRVMAVRTMAIDDAVREGANTQVVILGAGLDGRSWRLDALANATNVHASKASSRSQETCASSP